MFRMSLLTRLLENNLRSTYSRLLSKKQSTSVGSEESGDDEFRVLNLRAVKQTMVKKREIKKNPTLPPRSLKMQTDQDWTAVWPGPRSFHPASVPLPLRQGWTEKSAPSPGKNANPEILKIPNFLHLTPPAIKQQCEVLKKFCTPWPQGLETETKWSRRFPVEVSHTDFIQALPTIRNSEARRVTIRLKLSNLKFDAHARDKFLRLVGHRYDSQTDYVTIMADRCPMRKQNYDYALYLITASYHESFITEPWEALKVEADMEYYYFERNKSKKSATEILNWNGTTSDISLEPGKGFAQSVEELINVGENENSINKYKEEVLKLVCLKTQ